MAKRAKKKQNRAWANVAATAPWWSHSEWFWRALLAGAIVVAYIPVWWAGYIWDDDAVFQRNPAVIHPEGLAQIWTGKGADICPLTLTTFWLEYRIWGDTPVLYHLVTLLFHLLSAILLWRVLRVLEIPGAWLGTALWAMHPVMVESVAWATELKNTESGFFYLLSTWYFIRLIKLDGAAARAWRRVYALMLLFAAMAIACKSSTIILPFVLCLVAWWLEREWKWWRVVQVMPIVLFSLASGLLAMWTQQAEGAQVAILARSWPDRLATAADAVWFYLGKLLWPYPLEMTYPAWHLDTSSVLTYVPLAVLMILFSVFWLKRQTWGRPWFFALAYFLIALLPIVGLVNMKYFVYTQVADHFQYLAAMAPLVLLGAGATRLFEFYAPNQPNLRVATAAVVLVVLGILTFQKASVYKDEETLWNDTLAHNPEAWIGYNNIGMQRVFAHQNDAAIPYFRKAIAINPNCDFAWNNLGASLCADGDYQGGIIAYQGAMKVDPENTALLINLGGAYMRLGRFDEALVPLKRALEINPKSVMALTSLGMVYEQEKKPADAIDPLTKAVEIHPDDAKLHNDLGGVLYQTGHLDQALMQFREALRLNPNDPTAAKNLETARAAQAQMSGHAPPP